MEVFFGPFFSGSLYTTLPLSKRDTSNEIFFFRFSFCPVSDMI